MFCSKVRYIFDSKKRYIIIDWLGSIFGFLNTIYIYRYSKSIISAGDSGWILSLLTTSLFVSGAAQYYSMFKTKGIYNTYLNFLPIVILEICLLNFITDRMNWILISICLISNVFFSSFRGELMAYEKLETMAIYNVSEQITRLLFIIILVNLNVEMSKAVLISSTMVYVILAIIALRSSMDNYMKYRINFSIDNIKETFWYSLVHIGIFFVLNGDVLTLKDLDVLKGEFVLVKPWGQILVIIFTPLINLYLLSMKNNNNNKRLKYAMVLLFTFYLIVAFLGGSWFNYIIFNKYIHSSWLIFLTIVEHLFIILVEIMLYKSLYLNEKHLKIGAIIIFCIGMMILLPTLINNYFILIGYILIYACVFFAYSKIVMGKYFNL